MTYRDSIRNNVSGILFLAIVSWVCAAVLFTTNVEGSKILVPIFIIIFALCSFYISWLVECPKCMVSLGRDTLPICFPNIFIIRQCNNCQTCGFRFDNEIGEL